MTPRNTGLSIVLESVKKTFFLGNSTVEALRGIDLSVKKGEFLAIVGPSGSGKTTLFDIIGCIEKPTSGRLWLDGIDVTNLSFDELASRRAHKIGFVFQTFNLIPVLTALENVEYPLLKKCLPAAERQQRSHALLEEVGLGRHLEHKPAQLSGGQRQRVSIARALVNSPAIVLADEPTANLDVATGQGIITLMKDLNNKFGTTFMFSTNDPNLISSADRVVRIRDGCVDGVR